MYRKLVLMGENLFKSYFKILIYVSLIIFTFVILHAHTYTKLHKHRYSVHHCQGKSTKKIKEKKEIRQRKIKEWRKTKNLVVGVGLHKFSYLYKCLIIPPSKK